MKYNKILACAAACCILGASIPFDGCFPEISASAETSDIADTISFTQIGQTNQITFSGTTEIPTWYSDNENVATVSSDGTITAIGNGTAYVYCVFSAKVLKFAVVVDAKTSQVTNVDLGSVALSNDYPSATIKLDGVTADMVITWSSSDETVAKVSDSGVVTAVGLGSCIVTAYINGVNYNVSVTSTYVASQVVITEVNLGKLTLNDTTPSATIMLTGLPEGTEVTWSSNNTGVATVDNDGVVKACGNGTCQITALIGNVKYITDVTSEYTGISEVTEITLLTMELSNKKPTGQVILTGVPEGSTVVWSSTDTSIATVDQEGNITAVSSGTCKIIALIDGINYITNLTSTYVYVPEAEIMAESFTLNGIGTTLQLSLENSEQKPVWSSMNVNVATVDENGVVTAVGEGEAVILATLDNKVCKATVIVNADSSTKYGDANEDGDVSIADAILILQNVSNPDVYVLTEQGMLNADVYLNGDGVNAQDALSIQKKKANQISELPESYISTEK